MSGVSKIVTLKLKRVSLCGEPANEHAVVTLYKSRDVARKNGDGDMDDINCSSCGASMAKGTKVCASCGKEMKAMKGIDLDKIGDPETRKAVAKLGEDLAAAVKMAEEEQTKRIAAEKKAGEAEAALAKAKTPPPSDEDLLKNVPESVRKRLEKAEKEASAATDAIKKMADEKREGEFVAKARKLTNLSVDPAKFGPVLKRLADGVGTAEDVAEVERVLTAANSIAKATLFKANGSANRGDGTGTGQAWAQVQKRAEELRQETLKSGTKMSLPEAMDAVIKEHPELYAQHLREFSGRVRSASAGGAVMDEEE